MEVVYRRCAYTRGVGDIMVETSASDLVHRRMLRDCCQLTCKEWAVGVGMI